MAEAYLAIVKLSAVLPTITHWQDIMLGDAMPVVELLKVVALKETVMRDFLYKISSAGGKVLVHW